MPKKKITKKKDESSRMPGYTSSKLHPEVNIEERRQILNQYTLLILQKKKIQQNYKKKRKKPGVYKSNA